MGRATPAHRRVMKTFGKDANYGPFGRGHACVSDLGSESETSPECPREAFRLLEEQESGALRNCFQNNGEERGVFAMVDDVVDEERVHGGRLRRNLRG